MNKALLKYLAGGLALVAAAAGILYFVQYLRHRASPEYQAEQYFKDLERRYREDTYGGSTPEETLRLFIEALKKGDVELASKYFVFQKQSGWKDRFILAQKNHNLDPYIKEAGAAGRGKEISQGNYLFTTTDENGTAEFQISLVLNPNTQKWKIEDL